jgi:hypothetical protein
MTPPVSARTFSPTPKLIHTTVASLLQTSPPFPLTKTFVGSSRTPQTTNPPPTPGAATSSSLPTIHLRASLRAWSAAAGEREARGGRLFRRGSSSGGSSCSLSSSWRWRRAATRRGACSPSGLGRWPEAQPTISSGSCRGPRYRHPARRRGTTPSASTASWRSREAKRTI